MIIWINGCFGVGKSETAGILRKKITRSHIYDPEQVGYFLWDNFPEEMKRNGDFQDIPAWRTINYEVIKYMYDTYDGDIIIPMTLVDRVCFDEILGRLERDGINIKHFILTAPKQVIISRLAMRGEAENSWPERQIDRCLRAFDNDITGIKIDTESASAEGVAEIIFDQIQA